MTYQYSGYYSTPHPLPKTSAGAIHAFMAGFINFNLIYLGINDKGVQAFSPLFEIKNWHCKGIEMANCNEYIMPWNFEC